VGLVVVVVGDGLRVGGIKIRGLIEVVRGKSLDDLVVLCLLMAHVELGLGWAPGGMNQRRRGGLADVGEDSGHGLGVGEGPERSGDRRRGGGGWAVRGGNAMKVKAVPQVGQTRGNTS